MATKLYQYKTVNYLYHFYENPTYLKGLLPDILVALISWSIYIVVLHFLNYYSYELYFDILISKLYFLIKFRIAF